MSRCPECGGVANHILTDLSGKSYYRCMTGLTSFKEEGGELTRLSRIIPCDTIMDDRGRKFTGTIAYHTSDKVETLAVTNGKERK